MWQPAVSKIYGAKTLHENTGTIKKIKTEKKQTNGTRVDA